MFRHPTPTRFCLLILGILHLIFHQTYALRQGFAPRWIAERFCRGKHGIMKLPWDCSGYLHCTSAYYSQPSGSWFECGETLQFDGNFLSCVRSPSDCFKGLDVAVKICPDNPDLMFPHPDNCTMFYDCSQTFARGQLGVYENKCPDQQLFDPETGACQDLDDLEDDICNNKPATRCDNGRDCASIDPHCRGNPSGVNPKDGALFTSEYIVCLSGRQALMMHCSMGYVFDPVRKECSYDIRESVITYCRSNPVVVFPDSRHCARYYNCSSIFSYHGLNPYQSECPHMHLFDPVHSACVRHNTLTSPCGSRFEPINPPYAVTSVPTYKAPVQSPKGPQVCSCMKTISPLVDSLQNLTSFIDNSLLHLQDGNKLDCGQPPRIRNSEVTISYTNEEYVAVYTCDDGYSVCEGQLNTTCVRYNVWNTAFLGKCVQDTWRNLNNVILSCPPRVNTVLLIRGRSTEDLYTISLIDYNTGRTHLHMRLRSTSRTVEAGTSLESMKPVMSQKPLTGQITWTVQFKATTIEISVSDHHVISVPHTSDLSMINSLIISAAFQADEVRFYPDGIDAAVPKKHWSPFSCPDPPLIRRAAVQLSYTKSGALASYTCNDQHVMCIGNNVIHCYNESGWDASPGSCLKTVLDAGIGGSLSSFPVCPLRLGSGIEMWVTPKENRGVMEIFHSKTDIALRLELTLLDNDIPIALDHMVSDRLSTVKYPISQPFTKGRESQVAITRLSDQLLIEVDGEVLSHYPSHHLNADKALFIESSQGLIVRKARIYHDTILDVIRKPIEDNLALWASVEASSSYANPKFYGVDGNPIQSWPTGSCWNADIRDTKQWYQVDLARQYYIRDINIDITTKKSLESFLPAIVADPVLGGSQLALTPRSETDNLAFNKEASGSRDADSMSSPAHAVDGDVDSGNCYTSHSSVDSPWWMVDLSREYTISSVAIKRHDNPASASRLSDMTITIYESNPRTNTSAVSIMCIEKTGILGPFKRLPCVKPVTGQFVMITRTVGANKEPITICEVQVFKAIESRLNDFTVNVYEENPLYEEQITKRLCVKHIGEFPKDEPTTLTCAEDVWGRFVRIEADVIRDQYNMMTICEVEIYGDKAVKKEWSHFDCPDPPMISNAFVKVSHTPSEAVAHYECLDGFTMCKGPSVVTCSSSVGWKDNPGSCLSRTYQTDGDDMDIVHFCPVTLGEAIEIYLTPRETGFLLVLGTDVEAVFTMEWSHDSEIGNIQISTDWTAENQPIYVQGGPFELNKESKVLITFVTRALHISTDAVSFHTKISSEHLIDTVRTNKATITKMFHLQTDISEIIYVPSPDNLAAACQVSTSTVLGDAERTVDTDIGIDSCWSSARGDMDVWWTVELETLNYVSHVKLTTSGDCGDECNRRVHDFQIEMFHLDPSPKDTGDLCLKYDGVLPHASTTTLTCIKKVTGRVLRISAPGRRNPDDIFTLCEVEVFGGSVVKADHGSRNLALFRPVSVSSLSEDVTTVGGVVDGNRNTMYLSNSCWSAAGSDRNPWWLVELDNYYYITHVVITSTSACGAICENILQEFTIEVTPVEPKPDSQWDVCLQYDRVFQYGMTQTLYCLTSLLGRFMRIRSTGDGGTFAICEVEVYGSSISFDEASSTNLADHRPVSASTRHSPPEWAVDGNNDKDLNGNSCWTTEDGDANPWWMVELDDYYLVSEVELTSRSDCMRISCNGELSNFVIEMFHRKPRPGDTGIVCLAYKDVFPDATTQMLQCKDKAPTRYVRLSIPGRQVRDMLTLCEVRVFGAKLNRQGWTPFSCPTPPRHSNAHVQVCHEPDKAVATYSCDTNYTMCTGSEKIFCTSEVGWEGTPGSCVQTTLERHHGHSIDLSEFPICYPRLGKGFEMWITPKSPRNDLEFLCGNNGLRLIIAPDNTEETVAIEGMHNGIPSDVNKLNTKLFKLHQESHVVFMFLTSGILIRVDDKRLVSYPHHFIHTSSRINYVGSSSGLNIRMVRPVYGYIEGIIRVLSDGNLALNKVTSASSMQDTRHNGNIVDGNRLELGVDSLCWLPSSNDKNQWIMVDLSGFYYIKDIVLYNRVTDGCPQCTGNTQDFIIDVLQTDAADELTSICAIYEGTMPLAAIEKISCKDNVWGWYVRIQATGVGDTDSRISFCEIEIYGDEVIEKDQWSLYDCGVPPTLADASAQVSYSPGRAIATYTCDKDHAMCTGSHVMECSSRAGWEGSIGQDSFSICNLKLGEGIEVLIIPKAFGSSISLMFGPEGDIALQLRITPGHLDGNVHLTTVQGEYYSDVPLTSDLFIVDKEAHVVFIFLSFGIFILVDGEILTIYPHLLTTPKISFIQSTKHMHILMGKTIPRYMEGLSVRPFDENLALLEKTSASSSSPNSDHKHLVDGDISQMYGKCWSPHTGDREQWVRVEMGGYFFVREIILYGRGTLPCVGCAGSTHDFVIDVLATHELTSRCAVYEGVMPLGAVEKIRCEENVWGWYVRIQATDVGDDNDVMTFCEIQIYGDSVNKVL